MSFRKNQITASELIEWLQTVNKDAIVVVPGFDHSYDRVTPSEITAEYYSKDDYLGEYYGDRHMQDGCEKVKVVVFE